MTKQKRGLWTFLFSLLPGAGEMYMGFMKQGLSIMTVFWATIALASLLNMGAFLFVLPLLWFYSFFNVHNLKGLTEEEFYSIEDEYAFRLDSFISDKRGFVNKYRNVIASVLIFLGLSVLWNSSRDFLMDILPQYFGNIIAIIGDLVPQVVIGLAIIALGISLFNGKRRELDRYEE
jgi:TM2 domain-containing membrane protein YozV